MAKTSTKKPRKRRSFFEPDSKVLSKWLAEQNDLGLSLQVIIVDAIRNYGEGDVLQAFLKARESVPGEVPITRSTTLPAGVLTPPAPAKPEVKAEAPKSAPVAPKPPVAEPAPEIIPEPETAPEPVAESEPASAPEAAADAEYDPLEVMFADVGSTMQK